MYIRIHWSMLSVICTFSVMLCIPPRALWAEDSGAVGGDRVGQGDGGMSLFLQGTSNEEKLKFAREAEKELSDGVADLERRIKEARDDRDIVLLNCLNEKFSSVSALVKVTETARVLMEEAISRNNIQQSEHQFRKIVIARFKARQLLTEAGKCSGDEGAAAGSQEDPVVEVDNALEGTTITEGAQDPNSDIDDPGIDDINPVDVIVESP